MFIFLRKLYAIKKKSESISSLGKNNPSFKGIYKILNENILTIIKFDRL